MYQTCETSSYREEGGYRIDIHYVHTENGYHFDAALWQDGHCIDDKSEFPTRIEAIRWAQGQMMKNMEPVTEQAPTTTQSIGDEITLSDGRKAVVVDTFEKYGSAAFDAVTEDGQRVWVSGQERSVRRITTHDYWRSYFLRFGGSGCEQYFRPRFAVKGR